MTADVFRPPHEPAQSIYDAFQAEALLRKTRSFPEWSEREIEAVRLAATSVASLHGLQPPSLEMVRRAEAYSRGSIDYGAKWAHTLVRLMKDAVADRQEG